jgi:hypothetical protein
MKQYCYVLVLSNGVEHWTRVVGRSTEEVEEPNWDKNNLTHLLQHGWRPARESPMGGGQGLYAYTLVLLEKD